MTYTRSANITQLRESATIAVSARAKAMRAAGRPVIDLGAGEPDFPTPTYILAAAHRALDAGATRYTAVEGIAPLREAVASAANARSRSNAVLPDEVVVTAGTKQALFNACFSLFGTGDEVLVPTPAWTSYYEMLALARATPIAVFGRPDRDLKVTADDLLRSATSRTRGLILNSPCNPTGAVYDAQELAALVECARANGWWVISDEIYRDIAYDSEAPSVLDVVSNRELVVVVDGVAKSYAMTGWRIGWSIAPRPLTQAMTALQSHTTSNATTISQHAALAALCDHDAGNAAKAAMVSAFRQRRDRALEVLRRGGATVIEPRGAFYLYVRVGTVSADLPDPSGGFAQRLLEEHEVAVVPGAAFHSPEWVRVSYAAPIDDVLEGARRMLRVGLA